MLGSGIMSNGFFPCHYSFAGDNGDMDHYSKYFGIYTPTGK